ncbi:MAG TPA: MFS transporter [Polyangiaceae bacterium]|nr:MFS transporter [Polyangiaceae bacterium]
MAPRIRSPKLILALLTVLWLLNNLDRYVLAAVLAKVQGDLSLTNFVAGWLPSIFLIGYFATSPVFGRMGDRGRASGSAASGAAVRNALLAGGVAVWSAATVASGLAQNAASLMAARAFVGIGEASYGTLAPPLIDEIAPPDRKSMWMSIFSAATPIGAALGYLAGGAILHAYGWRAAFFVPGVPGIAAAVLCLLLYPERSTSAAADTTRQESTARVVRSLLSIGLYRSALVGYCAYTFAIGGFGYWAPKYLYARYGLDAGAASFKFGLVTVAGGIVGTLLGGALADRAVRRERARQSAVRGSAGLTAEAAERAADDATARANAKVCAIACAVGTPLALATICAPTAGAFFALALPCQIALFILSGPINVTLLRSAPLALRASAMAVCIFAIHAFGDLWSNPFIGLIADHAPMQTAMYAVPVAFLLAAIVWWRGALASARLT